jgi:hypothetical protein
LRHPPPNNLPIIGGSVFKCFVGGDTSSRHRFLMQQVLKAHPRRTNVISIYKTCQTANGFNRTSSRLPHRPWYSRLTLSLFRVSTLHGFSIDRFIDLSDGIAIDFQNLCIPRSLHYHASRPLILNNSTALCVHNQVSTISGNTIFHDIRDRVGYHCLH